MCPTAISMNTYVLRIHILTDIVNLCGKSVLTRHPDTGLARMPQCQSGIWKGAKENQLFTTATIQNGQSLSIGNAQFCALSYVYLDDLAKHQSSCQLFVDSAKNWRLVSYLDGGYNRCAAICFR